MPKGLLMDVTCNFHCNRLPRVWRNKVAPSSLSRIQLVSVFLALSDLAVRHSVGRTKIWPG